MQDSQFRYPKTVWRGGRWTRNQNSKRQLEEQQGILLPNNKWFSTRLPQSKGMGSCWDLTLQHFPNTILDHMHNWSWGLCHFLWRPSMISRRHQITSFEKHLRQIRLPQKASYRNLQKPSKGEQVGWVSPVLRRQGRRDDQAISRREQGCSPIIKNKVNCFRPNRKSERKS